VCHQFGAQGNLKLALLPSLRGRAVQHAHAL
jgi:hypothetical protein